MFLTIIEQGYNAVLDNVIAFVKSGDENIRVEISNNIAYLPWGTQIPVPECPSPDKPYFPLSGVLPKGRTSKGTTKVMVEVDGIEVEFCFTFVYTLTKAVTEKRWQEWSWKEEKGKVVFDSDKWRIELPFPESSLETREAFDFLTNHSVIFSDWNGDSGYSDTHSGYWYERIAYLAEKLGVEDPTPAIKQKLETEKQADWIETSEEVDCLVSSIRWSNGYMDYTVEDSVIYIKFGENAKLATDIPPMIRTRIPNYWHGSEPSHVDSPLANKVGLSREASILGKPVKVKYQLP